MKDEFMLDEIFDDAEDEIIINPVSDGDYYRNINLEKLSPHNKNRNLQSEAIENLADSILSIGLLDAPVVVDDGYGNFTIISGHHRIEACKLLKEKGYSEFAKIKCKIITHDELKNELQLIDANITSAPLTPYEMMMAIGRKEELLRQKKKQSQLNGDLKNIIASEGQIRRTQVGTYLKIYKCAVPCVKKALKDERITLTTAYNYSKLSPREQEDRLCKSIHKKDINENMFVKKVQNQLLENFQTTVEIKKHYIKIFFTDDADLNRILEKMDGLEHPL